MVVLSKGGACGLIFGGEVRRLEGNRRKDRLNLMTEYSPAGIEIGNEGVVDGLVVHWG
jgi:hypothetical protein